MAKPVAEEMNEKDAVAKLYELSFHIDPQEGEEGASMQFAALVSRIEALGGAVLRSEAPLFRPLAYDIARRARGSKERRSTAFFGSVIFEMDAENANALKSEVAKEEHILRSLLIVLPRYALAEMQKRKTERKEFGRKEEPREKETPPVSEEELERKLTEMIA